MTYETATNVDLLNVFQLGFHDLVGIMSNLPSMSSPKIALSVCGPNSPISSSLSSISFIVFPFLPMTVMPSISHKHSHRISTHGRSHYRGCGCSEETQHGSRWEILLNNFLASSFADSCAPFIHHLSQFWESMREGQG